MSFKKTYIANIRIMRRDMKLPRIKNLSKLEEWQIEEMLEHTEEEYEKFNLERC